MSIGARIVKLGDICSLDRAQNRGAALPYVGLEDIVSGEGRFTGDREPKKVQSSTFKFTSEHILYGRLRPYLNKIYLPNFDGHCSTEIFPIRPAPNADRRYIYYWLSMESTVKEIDRTSTGARMPRANVDAILGFPIPLPPLLEQQRIVAILDEAFTGLATATANAEKNLKNARELFDSFLNSTFVKKSGGSETRALAEISDFEGGAQPPKSKFVYEPRRDYVRLLQIRDFKSDKHAVYIPVSKNNRTCTETDVMIGRYGASVGQIHRGKAGAYNVALIKTKPDRSVIDPDYFYYYLRSNSFQDPLSKVAARSAQAGFSKDDINPFEIPLPSLSRQRKIVEELDALASESSKLEDHYSQRLDSLAMLKQSILEKAFSGELTPPPSQAIREAAE